MNRATHIRGGVLYVVGTPIGNLEDITLRALRILKDVDMILCEDTRVTKRLLQKYEIAKPTLSYHAQSGISKIEKIVALLSEGVALALVSDAGTPAISDPGSLLISRIREELPGVTLEVIPGASALTAALSLSGLPSSGFLFLGFLPHKKGRKKLFAEIADAKRTVIFYESPHRIKKTLLSLAETLSPGRRVFLARELTKIHEAMLIGSPEALHAQLEAEAGERVRGEFVVLVEPA